MLQVLLAVLVMASGGVAGARGDGDASSSAGRKFNGRKPAAHARAAKPTAKKTNKASRRGVKKAVMLERHVPAVRSGLPNIQAQGALVIDENGHELYARNPDHERPIASISKLAATLAVMDRGLELEGLSTITKGDIDVARGGARSRLLEGMTLSNRDLLHAALMGSDNRAIPALGRAVKLSPTQLAAAMTTKAKDLGLKKTRFHDPTGLSIQNVSTPRETIALLQAVMRHPVLGPITQRVQYDAHPVGRPPITYINTYRPAVRNNVQVLGGKTGYNDDARYCLVIAAKIDGHTCFMSFLANEGKLTRFGDVARVADWMVSRKPKPQTTVLAQAAAAPGGGTTVRATTSTTGPATAAITTTTTTVVMPSAPPGGPAATPHVSVKTTTAPATTASQRP
jgi:D-alanyl-D-alanine endopeptidase (penicillin-binding protein 7)